MRREINFKENSVSAILMRNRREILSEIPSQYITNITYDINTYTKMTIEIPNKITHMNELIDYPLYELIKGKMVILLTLNGETIKFIIDDDMPTSETDTISYKTVEAYSYEKTLDKKTFLIGSGATRQLYKAQDETVEIADGILNWLEQQTQWRVGHIDDSAKREFGTYAITTDTVLFSNFNKTVVLDAVLWEKTINIGNSSVATNVTISYNDMKTYKDDVLQKTETISHSFTNLPYPIKKIVAKYTSDSDYRFGVTYTLTLAKTSTSTITQTHKFEFANAKDMRLECPKINANYNTGEIGEQWTTKYRYFEECTTNWYGFLMNDVAKAFNVVFMFDSGSQTINVYDKETYGESRGLYLSYKNAIKSINKTRKHGDIVTRLTIESPHCSISEENPLGTEYVECYDYYINSGIMSSELKNALVKYDSLLEQNQIQFLQIKLNKTKENNKLTLLSSQLTALEEELKGAKAILSAYVTAQDTSNQATQSAIVKNLESQIATKQQEIKVTRDRVDSYQNQIIQIGLDNKKENAKLNNVKVFTQDDLDELEDYVVEGAIQDDTHTISYSLYNHALESVKSANKLSMDFSISVSDLMGKLIHPNGWQHYMRIGDKIEVDDYEIASEEDSVRLYGFTYSPKDNTITNLQFTNDKEPTSAIKSLANIGRQQSQTSTMTTFYKNVWKEAENNNLVVSDLIANGLDVAAQTVRGMNDVNRIAITEAGVYIADGSNTNHELYIGHGLISFTEDGWITSKLALDSNGLVADTLVGSLIIGEEMQIANEDATFKILPDGLHVYSKENGNIVERIFLGIDDVNGDKIARLRLHSADGNNNLVLSEEGMYQVLPINAGDNFDKDNPFMLDFYVGDNIQRIDSMKIRLKVSNFRGYTKGSSAKGEVQINGGTVANGVVSVSTETQDGGTYKIVSGLSSAGGVTISTGTGQGNFTGSLQTTIVEDSGLNPQHHHYITTAAINNHSHSFYAVVPSHNHPINVTIPNHKHKFEIDISEHEHDFDIRVPEHEHSTIYGIYKYQHSALVDVYIDNVLIKSNVTGTSEIIINSDKLPTSKGWHSIKIVGKVSGSNSYGLGYCRIDAYLGAFVGYN